MYHLVNMPALLSCFHCDSITYRHTVTHTKLANPQQLIILLFIIQSRITLKNERDVV